MTLYIIFFCVLFCEGNMKKSVIFVGSILLILCALLAVISPDKLSMVVVGLMSVLVALGFLFGISPNLQYISAFKQGIKHLNEIKKINSSNRWLPLSQIKPFFGQRTLDKLFSDYLETAMEQREQGLIISDIEKTINDSSLSVRSWRGVVLQVSSTLTAMGLLGTFLGLITGVSGVAFGTLQETVTGIENLLKGLTVAFYTSIVGVILSIVFNAIYRVVWNMMLRSLQMFVEQFHLIIQPEAEELLRSKQYLNAEQTLGYLSRIQDIGTKLLNKSVSSSSEEQRIMIELLAGVKRGEITFSLEPVCRLSDRTIIKAEAELKWNHGQLGTINPEVYMPIICANGYINKLDTAMWESVCEMLRSWYDEGFNPLPVILKISKTDILSMDIAAHISELISRYRLTPRDIELSLDIDAYTVCFDEAAELENHLLQKGFRVSVYGFNGDFMNLPQIRADEIKLELSSVDTEKEIGEIFEQAMSRHTELSANGIHSAKLLADVKRSGCGQGQGPHLYQQMTRKEYERLMKYC